MTGAAPVRDRSAEEQQQFLEAIARRTGNSVVATGGDGRIIWVNEGFTRLTGYTFEEALGRVPGQLLGGADTDPRARLRIRHALRAGQAFDEVVLNYAKSGRQYWVRIEAEPTVDGSGRGTGFIAVQTDVTLRRVSAMRERVLQRVGARLLSAGDVDAAVDLVLAELTATLDVRAACVWVVDPDLPHLRFVSGRASIEDAQPWVDICAEKPFRRGHEWVVGIGAPGMAWGTGEPCVKVDFWETDRTGRQSRRARAAQQAGIRTVCAVPVPGPRGVMAVIEIGGSHNYPGHELLPSLVEQVANHLGAFLARYESSLAFSTLFRSSPDLQLVVDATGRIIDANGVAVASLVTAATLRDILHRTDAQHTDLAALLGGDTRGEWEVHCADGHFLSVDIRTAPVTLPGVGRVLLVAMRDISERKAVEAALRRSLDEKQLLLREIHHRVKNNLQLVSSLVSLESSSTTLDEEVGRVLADTRARIRSIALVHEELYGTDEITNIPFDRYIKRLCHELGRGLAPHAHILVDGEPTELSVERAVPAGIILNELITNAFKHGQSVDGSLVLRVRVRTTEAQCEVQIEDEGPGVGSRPTRSRSLGQKLVQALVRQLRGELQVCSCRMTERDPGTRIQLSFPL